jgi:hypothetical protein
MRWSFHTPPPWAWPHSTHQQHELIDVKRFSFIANLPAVSQALPWLVAHAVDVRTRPGSG